VYGLWKKTNYTQNKPETSTNDRKCMSKYFWSNLFVLPVQLPITISTDLLHSHLGQFWRHMTIQEAHSNLGGTGQFYDEIRNLRRTLKNVPLKNQIALQLVQAKVGFAAARTRSPGRQCVIHYS